VQQQFALDNFFLLNMTNTRNSLLTKDGTKLGGLKFDLFSNVYIAAKTFKKS
jgi:hypothetical protein